MAAENPVVILGPAQSDIHFPEDGVQLALHPDTLSGMERTVWFRPAHHNLALQGKHAANPFDSIHLKSDGHVIQVRRIDLGIRDRPFNSVDEGRMLPVVVAEFIPLPRGPLIHFYRGTREKEDQGDRNAVTVGERPRREPSGKQGEDNAAEVPPGMVIQSTDPYACR